MFFTKQISLGKHLFSSIPEKIPDYITLLTKGRVHSKKKSLEISKQGGGAGQTFHIF